MASLPDIPVASWLEDQANRFKESTAGYLDSLFFDDQTKQQESAIPPDYDAPGGRDQWEQAAIDRRVEELRRQQEEDQRRIQEQQAQDAQRQQAEQAQQQIQTQQHAAGFLSSLGIPSPEEAFSGFQHWNDKPQDNVSSSGIFDARSADAGPHEQPYPGTVVPIQNPDGSITTERSLTVTDPDLNQGRATNIPSVWSGQVVPDDQAVENAVYSRRDYPSYDSIDEAEHAAQARSDALGRGEATSVGEARMPEPAPATPQSPAGDFLSWARGLTQPLLGSSDTVSPATTGGADSTVPPVESAPDHTSTTGIFDQARTGARNVVDALAENVWKPTSSALQSVEENPIYASAVRGGMTDAARILREGVPAAGEVIQQYGLGEIQRNFDRRRQLEQEQADFLGPNQTTRQILTQDIDPAWEAANPEKAKELRDLREQETMIAGGMAGGGSEVRITTEAVNAIKALRAAKLGEDVVLAAERDLASRIGSPLSAIQEMTRGRRSPVFAATQKAEQEREAGVLAHPDFRAHNEGVQTASQAEDEAFAALKDAEATHGEGSPEFDAAERKWLDAQETHGSLIQEQEATRQRLLSEMPEPTVEPGKPASPARAQKAFNAMEEIYATAVTAERDAARRYGPGSDEHQAARDALDYVSAQLEQRRAALGEPVRPAAEPPQYIDSETGLVAERPAAEASPPKPGIDQYFREHPVYGEGYSFTDQENPVPKGANLFKTWWASQGQDRIDEINRVLGGEVIHDARGSTIYDNLVDIFRRGGSTDPQWEANRVLRSAGYDGIESSVGSARVDTGDDVRHVFIFPDSVGREVPPREAPKVYDPFWEAGPVRNEAAPASAAAERPSTPPSGAPTAAEAGAARPTERTYIDPETGQAVEQPAPVTPEARQAADAVRTPTPAEQAVPRVLPETPPSARQGPPRPGEGPAPTPDLVEAAHEDAAKIEQMLNRTRGRANSRPPAPEDVGRVLNGITSVQQATTDRRAKLGALVRHIENLRGSKLTPSENAWLLARVYEGREDAALLRMERMLQDPLTKVGSEYIPELEKVAVQLDNIGMDATARAKEEARVLSTIPRVRARQQAPVSEVRRTGEAALEEQRARANLRSTEREWIAARNERNQILKEEPLSGPKLVRRQARGGRAVDPALETERSLSASDRLEKNNVRLETAKARHADARRIVDEIVANKRAGAEMKTRARALSRAEQIGEARKYSGGATPQNVDAVLQALVERVGPKKAQEITDGLDALYRYRDAVRDRVVKSGIWSEATGAEFKNNHPYYIPAKIIEKLDPTFLNSLGTGSRTFSSASDLIKHLTPQGTEADRMTPIRAMLEMGFQAEAAAQRNEVMKAVAGWADDPQLQNFVKKLKTSQDAPTGYVKMSAMIDGKAQSLAVHESLEPALRLSSPGFGGLLGAALKGASFPLRAGATALRPAFIATNAVNDALLTLFRFASEDPAYKVINPVRRMRDLADLFKGYHLAFGAAKPLAQAATGAFLGGTVESTRQVGEGNTPWNDPGFWTKVGVGAGLGAGAGLARRLAPTDMATIERFRASGASQGMQSRFRHPDDLVRQLAGDHVFVRTLTNQNDFTNWLTNHAGRVSDVAGMIWSRPLAEIGNIIESAPRYAAFTRAERRTGNEISREIRAARKAGAEITPEREQEIRDTLMQEQTPEIANYARRVTADFSAGGSATKVLNQIMPFLNASTQALVEGGDMTKKSPTGVAAATAAIVAATIYSEIHNRAVAPEDAKNVSEFTKNTGIVILSDKDPEGKGKRGLVYIPTRGIVGALVPLTKAALDVTFGNDQRTYQQLAKDVGIATLNQLSPVNADIGGLVGMFAPPPVAITGQAMSNYDYFRGQPIVSRSMEGLPISEQYDDRTSQFARHLARSGIPWIGGHSPMMTDWVIKNTSPGPGEAFLSAMDEAYKRTGTDLPSVTRDVPPGARDVPIFGPVVGRFLRTVGSAEQNRAYQAADEQVAQETPALVAQLERDPSYQNATPDRQRQMMRSLQRAIQDRAQELAGVSPAAKDLGTPPRFQGVAGGSALEKEIATAMSTPSQERTGRQRMLASQYAYAENPAYTAWNKRSSKESDRIREMVK